MTGSSSRLRGKRRHGVVRVFVLALTAVLAVTVQTAPSAVGYDSSVLRAGVSAEGIGVHLQQFQQFADAADGTRVDGSSGYFASARYVTDVMQQAGYQVTVQPYTYLRWTETAAPVLAQLQPNTVSYVRWVDFQTARGSGSGDLTALLQPVGPIVIPPGAEQNSTASGCATSDWASFVPGRVALVQQGTCTVREKVENARAAGAAAVIVFNEGTPGRTGVWPTGGTGQTYDRPVLLASFAVGAQLYEAAQAASVLVHVAVQAGMTAVTSENVIADSVGGRADRTVVVGAHLDSAESGPGINDNGSGSATILEIARQLAVQGIRPTNHLRFIWFGGEESWTVGSQHYVDALSESELGEIALYLNFDMLGSTGGLPGPFGSTKIARIFVDYFASQGLATDPTGTGGGGDDAPFTGADIPIGGVINVGAPVDPCLHLMCDRYPDNVNVTELGDLADAAAHTILQFAMADSDLDGVDRASDEATRAAPGAAIGWRSGIFCRYGSKIVPAETQLGLTVTWVAASPGLVRDFLNGHSTTLTINGVPQALPPVSISPIAPWDIDYWSVSLIYPIGSLQAGQSLDYTMELTATHPLHDGALLAGDMNQKPFFFKTGEVIVGPATCMLQAE